MGEISAESICEFLNNLLEIDRGPIEQLVETRVPCNEALANHPNVPVLLLDDGQTKIGLLGILNGIIAGASDGRILIGVYDENKLVKFELTTLEELRERLKKGGD